MTDARALALTEQAGQGVDLATAPLTYTTLQAISHTEFVPAGMRGKVPAILACVLAGRELGIGPMESLQKIDVIDGRPTPSAELLVAMVFRAGHEIYPAEITDRTATAKGVRHNPDGTTTEFTFTFTWDDAERARLTGKNNWRSYPGPMLYWRAASQLVRIFFPDVATSFKAYTADELGDPEWEPPDPNQGLVEDADTGEDPTRPPDRAESPQQAESSNESAVTVDFEPPTLNPGEVSVDEGIANVVEAFNGEVVDMEAEESWETLIRLLSENPSEGTARQIEERVTWLCSLMETNDLWPADSLLSLLQRWPKVNSWAQIGKKDAQIRFAKAVFEKAAAKVKDVLSSSS